MAFLLKHDSVGGVIPNDVRHTDTGFTINGAAITKLNRPIRQTFHGVTPELTS